MVEVFRLAEADDKKYDLNFPVMHPDPDSFDDWRLFDQPDAPPGDEAFDQFSRTFPEFKVKLERRITRYLGRDWKRFIADRANTSTQKVDQMIRRMWDGNFTDHEATNEIFFMFDMAQNEFGYDGHDFQKMLQNGDYWAKPLLGSADPEKGEDFNDPRPGRPVGVDPKEKHKLIFRPTHKKEG
jgi:hypothetical protein